MTILRILKFSFLLILLILPLSYYLLSADAQLKEADKVHIQKVSKINFTNLNLSDSSFAVQIKYIDQFQKELHDVVSVAHGIPEGVTRRPEDLLEHGSGLCYDLSLTKELAFQYMGLETRHIFLIEAKNNIIETITSTGTPSHAITEVKTALGWMMVESNAAWMGLDQDKNPLTFAYFTKNRNNIIWDEPIPFNIYQNNYTPIYGLYSRHGQFYPPYNDLPDYHWKDVIWNFREN